MSLLITPAQLLARRPVALGALAPLASGLRRELAPLLARPIEIPRGKALLTRAGGRCDRDGALLAYDPFDARHLCPECGREVIGDVHDRFRLYWHHLWIAERALHGALLGELLDDAACSALSLDLLEQYSERYLDYPNRDNVLGPARPFFSTYLESIWLLQLTIALDILESGAPSTNVRAVGGRVRDRLIAPSAVLIASYDEGMSNRQVWSNAALLAAGLLLGEDALCERVVVGPSGLHAHLGSALLDDGSWYEGENYHLFAHRGLWYGVQMSETNGRSLPGALAARFRDGFVAPFRTLLPDLTFPSRRDSQYAVSVRQPRFAESCELGLARGDDERLVGMLARLYDSAVLRRETGRARSSADVERNLPATGLERADLSWRALLLAREQLPPLRMESLTSDLLSGQGIAVLRRESGAVYVALDYGHSGGGHGHPDRLNLLLVEGDRRWFDDPGTGSYVDPSLHWYRSTLAHTAPLIDGRSQPRVHGRLMAFDDDGSLGWASAACELMPGLQVRRAVVLLDDYLVDVLEWEGATEHDIALPLHGVEVVDTADNPLPRTAAPIDGGEAAEDGFVFLRETARVATSDAPIAMVRASAPTPTPALALRGWLTADGGTTWWSALAPDVPSRRGFAPLLLVRRRARRGRMLGVWSWRGAVAAVELGGGDGNVVVVTKHDGARDVHEATPAQWRVVREQGGTARVALLGGVRDDVMTKEAGHGRAERSGERPTLRPIALPATFKLGTQHYRRSEESWSEAGSPGATVSVASDGARALRIEVDVAASHRCFVPIDADNPLDNEPAAINGDGVQLYLTAGEQAGGWLLVPEHETGTVGVRSIVGWDGLSVRTSWRKTDSGWALTATVALPAAVAEVALDVLVNETAPGRARRRGQLVLSGAEGEFVYLRGDRHDRGRLLRFIIADA